MILPARALLAAGSCAGEPVGASAVNAHMVTAYRTKLVMWTTKLSFLEIVGMVGTMGILAGHFRSPDALKQKKQNEVFVFRATGTRGCE